MLTKEELFVVEAMEGDDENSDDRMSIVPPEVEERDVYGDGGLGLRSLYEIE